MKASYEDDCKSQRKVYVSFQGGRTVMLLVMCLLGGSRQWEVLR